ncbi:hypothetical protein [Bacteroides sp.]|uniref:hypothetical protein n=1 Tax=Bacteroides sp. TaxID=29523 RepID=UPI00260CA317|nr:hypothetical protein [Bacteroides sp.]MDD3039075.1 hypothetical protein [Bacteroides sp.]
MTFERNDKKRIKIIENALETISNAAFDNWVLSDTERMEISDKITKLNETMNKVNRRLRNMKMTEHEHLRRITLLRSQLCQELVLNELIKEENNENV